jgi:hypothetical protein
MNIMNNKDTTLKIIIVTVIILSIRYIGIKHIPPMVILLIFLFTVIFLIYKITVNKKQQIKDTYYLIFACLFIAFASNSMIMFLLQYKFPQYMIIAKPIVLSAFVIIFISLIIHVYIWAFRSNK